MRRRRRERTETLMNSREFMDRICGELTAGNTLVAFCRELDIIFNLVNAWIQVDAERRKRYAEAIAVREKHHSDEIITELVSYLRADITEAFDRETGALKPLHEMPANVRKLIAGVEVEEIFEGRGDDRRIVGTLRKVKFWDKPRSMETLMKHLKMLVDRHEVSGKVTLADLLAPEDDERKPDDRSGETLQ